MNNENDSLADFELIGSFYEAVGRMLTIIFKTQGGLIGSSLADTLQEIHSFSSENPPHEIVESIEALQELDVHVSMLLEDLISLKLSRLREDAVNVRGELIKLIQFGLKPLISKRTGSLPAEVVNKEKEKRELQLLTSRARELIKQMSFQVSEVDKIRNTTAEIISRTDADVKDVIRRVDEIEAVASEKISRIDNLFSDSLTNVIEKEEQVNKILGHLSGRAISGDFENNAGEERRLANNLRYASVFCMFLVVLIAGYSFVETTKDGFDWGRQVSRFLLMLLITVPAAYLARESERHRKQHYSYLQKSLDLKTITPFLASLPEEEQHRIKAQIAGRLFVSGESLNGSADSFPINAQELLIEVIRKLESSKGNSAK